MWKELMYKWFGLPLPSCETCEVLREQLVKSERERMELLHRLLDKDKPEPPSTSTEELKPIMPQFVPWRVRQQILENEDKRRAELMRERTREIDKLERELGVSDARKERETISVHANDGTQSREETG